jgi:hypothetical protein
MRPCVSSSVVIGHASFSRMRRHTFGMVYCHVLPVMRDTIETPVLRSPTAWVDCPHKAVVRIYFGAVRGAYSRVNGDFPVRLWCAARIFGRVLRTTCLVNCPPPAQCRAAPRAPLPLVTPQCHLGFLLKMSNQEPSFYVNQSKHEHQINLRIKNSPSIYLKVS